MIRVSRIGGGLIREFPFSGFPGFREACVKLSLIGDFPIPNRDFTALLSGVSRFAQGDSGILFSGYIKEPEMEHYPTVKEFEISSVRIRMEARKEAQSKAWEAILRTAGGDVDFDRDDLLALEDRARVEWIRACKARDWKVEEETKEDRAERAAEYRENARKWPGVAEDLLWRSGSDGDDD